MGNVGSREGLYSCNLVPHAEGHFSIGKTKFRPEWGRSPIPQPDNHDEVIQAMVREGVRDGQTFYENEGKLPARVSIEAWTDEGAIYVSVNKPNEWKLVR